MNALIQSPAGLLEQEDSFPEDLEDQLAWTLRKLSPRHKQICALLAQGFKNIEIATVMGVTKEYVSMLLRQLLIQEEIARVCEIAETRLDAMFVQTVDVISDGMSNGNITEKLKAARLQLEATKRIGHGSGIPSPVEGGEDRLEKLANRLTQLLAQKKESANETHLKGQIIEEAEFRDIYPGGNSAA